MVIPSQYIPKSKWKGVDSNMELRQSIMYGNEVAKRTPYDGYYATKTGKVLSVWTPGRNYKDKSKSKKINYAAPKLITPETNRTGYIKVRVQSDKKTKAVYLHKLVYETWVGPTGINGEPDSKIVIDHINGDITDNNINNLRLLTRTQNSFISDKYLNRSFAPKMYKVFVNGVLDGIFSAYEMTMRYGVSGRDRSHRTATRRIKKADGTVISWEYSV